MGVMIDPVGSHGTVAGTKCYVDPDCKTSPKYPEEGARHAAFQAVLVPKFGAPELRKRVAWANANITVLDRRLMEMILVHELGHASGAYHHGTIDSGDDGGAPTCPMRYWHTGDEYVMMADFIGGKWDLKAAHDGTPWTWCDENRPQMRFSDRKH